jgi:dihydrofolate synthase/folylpolyglutamate synthase
LTLDHWLQRVETLHARSIDLGLERVARVARLMGFTQTDKGIRLGMPTIVVGGTNGKGSTCAMLESILMQSGFRTAMYTSPHMIHFNERLRIEGCLIDDASLVAAFGRVETARGDTALTYFEFTTLAILDIIHRADVDVAILEIGLGGRLDAVNIVDSDCAVLVSVDLDHQEFLGDTREAIGWEKAHIARRDCPFICADPRPPETVEQVARAIGADIWRLGVDFNFQGDRQQWSWAGRGQRRNALAYPALRGVNQLINASAALAALSALRHTLPVSQGAVRSGLALVEIPGRFQVLPGQPAVILDVAHNPHAAGVLAANLDQMGFFPKTIAVAGILSGKDAPEIFRRLGERIDHWCLATLDGSHAGVRARTSEDLLAALHTVHPQADAICFSNPAEAYRHAQGLAGPNDRIVVFGSFVTVAEIEHLRHAR